MSIHDVIKELEELGFTSLSETYEFPFKNKFRYHHCLANKDGVGFVAFLMDTKTFGFKFRYEDGESWFMDNEWKSKKIDNTLSISEMLVLYK